MKFESSMFDIKTLGTANNEVKKLEKCIQKYFKPRSKKILEFNEFDKSCKTIKNDLRCRLAAPHVMGSMFRWVCLDWIKFGKPKLLITVAAEDAWISNNWANSNVRHVLIIVSWIQAADSLKGICLEEIKERIIAKDKVSELNLPKTLEKDLENLFE